MRTTVYKRGASPAALAFVQRAFMRRVMTQPAAIADYDRRLQHEAGKIIGAGCEPVGPLLRLFRATLAKVQS